MNFSQVKLPDGSIDSNYIFYVDDNGEKWIVPADHRFWTIYQDWIAAGNTPLPPQ